MYSTASLCIPTPKLLLDAAPVPDPAIEKGARAAPDQGRIAESSGTAVRMRLQYALPAGKPGMPGDSPAARREKAGAFCRVHQGLDERQSARQVQ